jgi:hypothetical protein
MILAERSKVERFVVNSIQRPSIIDIASTFNPEELDDPVGYLNYHGFGLANMDRMLKECSDFAYILPILINALISQSNDRHLLCLARDTEIVYDALSILHEEREDKYTLFPASMQLARDLIYRRQNHESITFLNENGLDNKKYKEYMFVETGFVGSVPRILNKILSTHQKLNQSRLSKLLRFKTNVSIPALLISTHKETENIKQLKVSWSLYNHLIANNCFERTRSVTSINAQESFCVDKTASHTIAAAMQLIPRYHGCYAMERGELITIDEGITTDIDLIKYYHYGDINASLVNPLAALAVQMKLARELTK